VAEDNRETAPTSGTAKNGPSSGAAADPRRGMHLPIVVGVLIVAGVVAFWLYSRTYESTDDAQVSGHLSGVTARIEGVVQAVHAEENEFIEAGAIMAEMDARDYEVALAQAQAQLRKAEANVRAQNPNVPIALSSARTEVSFGRAEVTSAEAAVEAAERDHGAALARLREAEANNVRAQADLQRYKSLVDKEEVARAEYDRVFASASALAAVADSARAQAQSAQKLVQQRRAVLDQARSRLEQADVTAPNQIAIARATLEAQRADVQVLKAQLERAQLDLSYGKIAAPVSGVVTNRTVQAGEHVSKGQRLFTIADLSDLWVTANFKENQLEHMRTGQRVSISVDAFGQKYEGYVEAMPGATGSVTSLLPPENATGNYVKVVQRLPVRIRFNPGQAGLDRLRPGMSVVPKVRLR